MLIAPSSGLQGRRCARCGGGGDRQDVWVLTMDGRLVLHADCAEGLRGDLEADLSSLLWLSRQEERLA